MISMPSGECPPYPMDADTCASNATRGIKAADMIIDNELDDKAAGFIAGIGDQSLRNAHELSAPLQNGEQMLPRYTSVQSRIGVHRAILSAINPEASTLTTAGLSVKAVFQAALVERRSRTNYAAGLAKAGLSGGIALAVAASQRLDGRIPGVHDARHALAKRAKAII